MLLFLLAWLLSTCVWSTTTSQPSWTEYVRAPASRIVKPEAVLQTNGSVVNADGLIHGHGVTTLQRPTTDKEAPSITLDFGQNVVGFLQIHFAGASKNNPGIRVAFSETKEYLANISDFTRSENGDTITPGTDQFAVPSQPTTWNDRHGCLYNNTQVCVDGLHGFRYLWIKLDALASDAPHTQPNGTVEIASVDFEFSGFLGRPETYTGYFECSNENLTKWWFDAAYTNEMITANFTVGTADPRDAGSPTLTAKLVLQDGAKRDRDPYVGDIAVSGRTAYLTHSQNSPAAKDVLADLANHQTSNGWIPPASINDYTLPLFDYPMWWVVSSWEYILYSGDTAYATQHWPNLVSVLDDFYVCATNSTSSLLSKGLCDTQGYGDYAFLPRTGEVMYYNALYVYALQTASTWAQYKKQNTTATRWLARAKNISAAVNSLLWDLRAGAYLDSTNLTTSNNEPCHAQDGNSLAIIAGIATASRAGSVLNYITNNMKQEYGNAFYDKPIPTVDNATERVYAFLSAFELQARMLTAGFATSALEEIDRLYGWMATHDPLVTNWEGIGSGGSPYEQGYTSMAHGWSTGIVSIMSNYVLGILPTAPGFDLWTIKPFTASLTWARGQVDTPHGPLHVSCKLAGDQTFRLNLTSPMGTSGNVSVPGRESQRVYVDGHVQKLNWERGYATLTGVAGGTHRIVVK